jgi:nucleotide-binding universal stress UspA family protein
MYERYTGPRGTEVVCVAVPGHGHEDVLAVGAALAERLDLALGIVEVTVPSPSPAVAPLEGPHPIAPVPAGAPLDGAALPDAPRPSDVARSIAAAAKAPARVEALAGPPGDIAEREAAAPRTQMLVVGDDGGGLLEGLAGAAPARHVLRSARSPVVVVPSELDVTLPERPTLLYLREDDPDSLTAGAYAETLAGDLGGFVRTHDLDGDDDAAADAVRAAARESRAALLVGGRPHHGALLSALLGSATVSLLRDPVAPLVVVPPAVDLADG